MRPSGPLQRSRRKLRRSEITVRPVRALAGGTKAEPRRECRGTSVARFNPGLHLRKPALPRPAHRLAHGVQPVAPAPGVGVEVVGDLGDGTQIVEADGAQEGAGPPLDHGPAEAETSLGALDEEVDDPVAVVLSRRG